MNVRDIWDSTPLYYACLCGHLELVEYLLENGARCDASSFDGERCLYGALTDQIRKILKEFSVLSSTLKRREPFDEFLRRLMEEAAEADVTFNVRGITVNTHRFLLATRSQYFNDQFRTRWKDKDFIYIGNKMVDPDVFVKIIEYLYTGKMKILVSQCEDAIRLCKQCKLFDLREEIADSFIKADSFVESKRGVRILHVQVETSASNDRLRRDLQSLARTTLPNDPWSDLPFENSSEAYSDLIFRVQGSYFRCHKAMFSARSDYFRALIEDHFKESSIDEQSKVTVININDVQPDIFSLIVAHVYSNGQDLEPNNVYDVLEAAEMFLLPELKRQCGVFLADYLDSTNVVDLCRTARLFDIPRLEHACVSFMARNVEDMVSDEKFALLVKEDAENVKNRQATDSIDIIDEMRFVLRTNLLSVSAIEEAHKKLEILDEILTELGFEV